MTQLKIIKMQETKSMIDFSECYSGLNICLMKSNFNRAFNRFKIWRNNQFGTDFTSELFRLACHADDNNKYKLLVGFPDEMVVYLLWYKSESEEKFFEEWGNVEEKEPEREEIEE